MRATTLPERSSIVEETTMTTLTRRTVLLAAGTAAATSASPVLAVDALPDARFVGFAQAVNEFAISSGQLALARSTNENIRGFATRAVAEANQGASALSPSRQEAGVSYAPDGAMGPKTTNLLAQLNALQGPAFDTAFANAQLSVQTDAEAQFGALFAKRQERPAPAIRPGDPSQV